MNKEQIESEVSKMLCPKCGSDQVFVADSRPNDDCVNRIRKCRNCEFSWKTVEFDADMLKTDAEKPEKVRIHSKICTELNQLYERKNADYGDSFSKSFAEYGLTMSSIRLEDKLNRFKSLIRSEAQVKDESIEDTLVDLANYAIMTLIELRGEENERN